MDLANYLRQTIRETGWSLHELSRRSGVAVPMISRFVKSERSLKLESVSRLCEALGLQFCSANKKGKKHD